MGLFSKRGPQISVHYESTNPEGLDQTVRLRNGTEVCLRPRLAFEAVDPYGRTLPHVTVGTVLGIDRGTLVAPPGAEVVDVLHFQGQGAEFVRGVRIGATSIDEVNAPDFTKPAEVLMIDLNKRATLDPEEFWGVGVANPNDTPISVSVTLVELEAERKAGEPRRAIDAVTLAEPVDLSSRGHDVVWLPEEVRGRYHAAMGHAVLPE